MKVFFYVFRRNGGGVEFAKYYDDPPSSKMLKQVLLPVLYRREITGTKWAAATIGEIQAEYERLVAENALPPSNMAKGKPANERPSTD